MIITTTLIASIISSYEDKMLGMIVMNKSEGEKVRTSNAIKQTET